jgi:Zn-dependent peptidase ImmA (M78 family)
LVPVRKTELDGDFGRTDFDPPTIWIDEEVLQKACRGDPFGRYVLAHELGHLDQHDVMPKSRSALAHSYAKAPREMSSEWQADEFAFHFLCPAHIVQAYSNVYEVMEFCQVSESFAQRAFDQYVTFQQRRELPKSVREFLSSFDK